MGENKIFAFENSKSLMDEVVFNEQAFFEKPLKVYKHGNPRYIYDGKQRDEAVSDLGDIGNLQSIMLTFFLSKRVIIKELMFSISKNSNISIENALLIRSLIERIAIFHYVNRVVKNSIPVEFKTDSNFFDITEILAPRIVKATYATSMEWRGAETIDFKTEKLERYNQKDDDLFDRSPLNIMTPVAQLGKKIAGIQNVYNYLSEFAHPNAGDVMASSTKTLWRNSNNSIFIRRDFQKSDPGQDPVLFNHWQQIDEILALSIEQYLKDKAELAKKVSFVRETSRVICHGWLAKRKKIRKMFISSDLCPCGSGKNIKQCKFKSEIKIEFTAID